MDNDKERPYWIALIVVRIAIIFLILSVVVGCGSSKRSIVGRYQFGLQPQFYIELRSNGDYYFGSTSDETEIWPYEWPMGISLYFDQKGTWRLTEDSTIVLRSMGREQTFGNPQNGEIIDIFGTVWQKK